MSFSIANIIKAERQQAEKSSQIEAEQETERRGNEELCIFDKKLGFQALMIALVKEVP